MNARLLKIAAAAAVATALALGGAAWAIAGSGGDGNATGPGANQAKAAALAHTGGGTANSVERDSENGATWEVEVTKPNGQAVDVRLDASYKVVVVESDSETTDAPGSQNERNDDDQQGEHDD
jgi:Peptidase propeptide and YPEB domain